MPRGATTIGTALRRLVRRVGLDHNPLRRRTDKIETCATLLLIAIFTLAAPAAAWQTGQDAYSDGVRSERVEQAAKSQTTAVLLADPVVPPLQRDAPRPSVRVQALWRAPGGTPITGPLPVSTSAQRGTRISVWVDRTGRLVDPPQRRADTIANAAMQAGFVVSALAVALIVIYALLHHALQQRRLAAWQTAWLRVEPLWTRRRRDGHAT